MIAAPSKGANRNLLKSKPSNRHSRMYLAGIHNILILQTLDPSPNGSIPDRVTRGRIKTPD